MTTQARKSTFALSLAALLGAGCAAQGAGTSPEGDRCTGKCDSGGGAGFEADLQAMNEESRWDSGPALESIREAFGARVDLQGVDPFFTPTHLFDTNGDGAIDRQDPVRILPYADSQGEAKFSDGRSALEVVEHIDAPINEHFPPNAIGFGIKHHRIEHRTFDQQDLTGSSYSLKENAKLQDTHIEMVVGVEGDDGKPGIITMNNPQSYADGRFDGSGTYPMIFVRPKYPEYLDPSDTQAFRDNIRSMMVGFNAVSNFPGEYNGGDPLGAQNPEGVRALVAKMVRAVTGDEQARAWFDKDQNLIYCAELAHVSASAGMMVPLNEPNIVDVLLEDPEIEGEEQAREIWQKFAGYMEAHNAGEMTPFVSMNANKRVAAVQMATAPAELQPAAEYAPESKLQQARQKMAFKPMTAADLVSTFVKTLIPRDKYGERMAPLQAKTIAAMKAGLLESMGLSKVTSQARQADVQLPGLERLLSLLGELESRMATPEELGRLEQAEGRLEQAASQASDPRMQPLVAGLKARIGAEKLLNALVGATSVNYERCEPTVPEFQAMADKFVQACSKAKSFGPQDPYERFRLVLEGTEQRPGPMTMAREMTGPRRAELPGSEQAVAYYVPPSLLHMVAHDDWEPGLLDLEYVGHGLHYRYVQNPGGQGPEPAPEPELPAVLGEKTGRIAGGPGASGRIEFDMGELERVPEGADRIRVELQTTRTTDDVGANLWVTDESTAAEDYLCTSKETGLIRDACEFPADALQDAGIEVTGRFGTEFMVTVEAVRGLSDPELIAGEQGGMEQTGQTASFHLEPAAIPDGARQLRVQLSVLHGDAALFIRTEQDGWSQCEGSEGDLEGETRCTVAAGATDIRIEATESFTNYQYSVFAQ